jgi:hypothetical protein
MRGLCKSLICVSAAAASVGALGTVPVDAATIAYWRFEGDGVTTPTDGTFVQDTNGRVAVQPAGIPVIDASGNGNTVYTWDNNATGHQYRPNVPAAVVPLTGAPNNFAIQNNGANPASFTWSSASAPGTDVETIKPLAWTIEASIHATGANFNGHRTFVGRDGNGVNSLNGNTAPLYFKTFNGRLFIEFADEDGRFY